MPVSTLKMNYSGNYIFEKTGYAVRNYDFTIDSQFDNVKDNFKGWTTDIASAVLMKVLSYNGLAQEDVTIKIYRYDYGTGTNYLIASTLTDVNGEAPFYLTLNTVQYLIEVYRGSVLLTSFPNRYITASTVTLVLPFSAQTGIILADNINTHCEFLNNSCSVTGCFINCSYSTTVNASSLIDYFILKSYGNKQNIYSVLLCSNSSTNTTGVLSCNITGFVPVIAEFSNYSYFSGALLAVSGGIEYTVGYVALNYLVTTPFGAFGYFMTFGMMATLFFIGRKHITVALMMSIMGLIASQMLGFISLNYLTMGGYMVLIILVILFAERRGMSEA
jgi:hypothetical protein